MSSDSLTLDELIDSGDPREIKRAVSVKMFLQGYSREQISQLLNIGGDFVTKWNIIYRRDGAKGLRLHYKGGEGYLDESDYQSVLHFIRQHVTITVEELARHLKEEYDVIYASSRSYYDLLHAARMSWKKTEKVNPKRNEEAVVLKREEIKKRLQIT